MNISILTTSSNSGGAAIAAHRLMNALNRSGEVEAKMLVRDNKCHDKNVLTIGNSLCNKLKFAFERGLIWSWNRFSRNNLFQVSIANTGYDVTKAEAFNNVDIIHIHWTQQGFLSLNDMKKIFSSGKPVVWTMHDMWACTGICHHSEECEKFMSHCHSCQYLTASNGKDLSYRIFERKKRLYQNSDFTVVACSRWLQGKAQSSALLKGKRIVCIPNPIDDKLFSPLPEEEARKELGLPLNAKLVLFASQKVTDKRKGIDYLVAAAKILKEKGTDMEFVIMGGKSDDVTSILPFKCHSLGYIDSEEKAAKVYNACNLFVTPSLMENLPNTIMEAMACGTPCVGFNIGGIPEMIDHKTNGYVAEYKSASDLAEGISWVIENSEYKKISQVARDKVLKEYSEKTVAQKFVDLYKSISK